MNIESLLLRIPNIPPPSDESQQTKNEILLLESLPLLKDRKDFFADSVVVNAVAEMVEDLGWDSSFYDTRMLEIWQTYAYPTLVKLKKHFNRLRPYKMDNSLEYPWHVWDKGVPPFVESSSYPSGHSAHMYFMIEWHSLENSNLKTELYKSAEEWMYKRLCVKNHFPSDISYGMFVGALMANILHIETTDKY